MAMQKEDFNLGQVVMLNYEPENHSRFVRVTYISDSGIYGEYVRRNEVGEWVEAASFGRITGKREGCYDLPFSFFEPIRKEARAMPTQ